MGRAAIEAAGAAAPKGSYSHAVVAGGFLFTSGSIPRETGSERIPAGIGAQTTLALAHLRATLAQAGLTLDDVVKVTVQLADLADFAGFDAAYARCFDEPYPARITCGAQLPAGVLVQIDAVAALPGAAS